MKKIFTGLFLLLLSHSAFSQSLESDTLLRHEMDEFVVSTSRFLQKITEAPSTIDVINRQQIREFSGPNVAELLSTQKGIDFTQSGVLSTSFNIRGFNSAFNVKNLQITDDRIQSMMASGLPMGNLNTTIKEDIEKIEVLLGPNGTLYGPNAHNGLINTISRNPFTSEGTTFVLGYGNRDLFSARFRHAQKINDQWAFKVAFERSQAKDPDFTDSVYVDGKAYPELDLDRKNDVTRFNGQINYRVTPKSELIGYYGRSKTHGIQVSSAGRNQSRGWSVDEAQLKYVHPQFFINTYYQWSNTDNTYAMDQRTQNYLSMVENGFSDQEAKERSYLQQWAPDPDLPEGGTFLSRGAVFKDNSRRYVAEGQYHHDWEKFRAVVGTQFIRDMVFTKNTYMLDQDGRINVNQIGAYGQVEYHSGGWGLLAAARIDHHSMYKTHYLPKAALTRKVGNGTARFTYAKGIAAPPLMNLEGYLFGGVVLGNSKGFTLEDGTKIAPLSVETIQTLEVGYKGQLTDKIWIDADAFYNFSENFISPLQGINRGGQAVTLRGETPLTDIPGANPYYVLTYSNFGKVNTYGWDISLSYFFRPDLKAVFTYSYFGRSIDKKDLKNDGNGDGIVTETDLPINTPKNKFNIGVEFDNDRWYASIYGRYIQKYNFFSGIAVASKTLDLDGDGTPDIIENSRTGSSFNYGPLGGFLVDAGAGYHFDNGISLGLKGTNLLNAKVYQSPLSPIIKPLFSIEVKYHINFFGK